MKNIYRFFLYLKYVGREVVEKNTNATAIITSVWGGYKKGYWGVTLRYTDDTLPRPPVGDHWYEAHTLEALKTRFTIL